MNPKINDYDAYEGSERSCKHCKLPTEPSGPEPPLRKRTIHVEQRWNTLNGIQRFRPVNKNAQDACCLTRNKTLSEHDLSILEGLGFNLHIG